MKHPLDHPRDGAAARLPRYVRLDRAARGAPARQTQALRRRPRAAVPSLRQFLRIARG